MDKAAITHSVRRAIKEELATPKAKIKAAATRDLASYPASMSVAQVAAALNCSFQHVLNLIDCGKLTAKNIGTKKQRCLRVRREHIAQFLAGGTA